MSENVKGTTGAGSASSNSSVLREAIALDGGTFVDEPSRVVREVWMGSLWPDVREGEPAVSSEE